jgi:tripartite-type tricarboxylate transporter receptor subunit TctC
VVKAIAVLAAWAALMPLAQAQNAQPYPSKAVRVVVPYPNGGGTDFTARPIAARLSEHWGVPVIVDSRPGASAMIGTDIVAKSAPDGYTILISASSEVSMNAALFKKMPYDPVLDLQPITLIGSTPPLILSHPSLPVKSFKELIAFAKARPGVLSYASIGNGTPQHFAGELIKSTFKIDLAHVPYKGAAPALIDMLGGHVPFGIVAPTVALPHVKSGKLRALAQTSAQRSSSMPDIPTVNESGGAGFDIVQWYAAWLPAKTPKDIVDKLHDEIVRIVQSPDYKQRQLDVATDVIGSSAQALADFQKVEIEKYKKIGAAAGIKPE